MDEEITPETPGADPPPLLATELELDPHAAANSVLDWLESLWLIVITPGWRQYQILILLGLVGLSILLRLATRERIDGWMRARAGWPKWQLRLLIHLRDRLSMIYFVILSWTVYAVMQEVTWPSRSWLIGIVATIALAWLAIGIGSRLVRNRTLRRVVEVSLWAYVTLLALGFLDETVTFLDQLALSIGTFRLTALVLIKALVLITALLIGARLLTNAAAGGLRRNEDISPSMQVLGIKITQLVLYGMVVLFGVQALGFDLTGLAILSGAIGVGIGFGLQKVVSNLVSGVIILLDRSIKPGDVISLGETFGWIDSLGARYVSVVTRDGREYLIPNEDLITGQVVNWTHSNERVRLDIHFGTSYQDDPHKVRRVAIEAASGVQRVLSVPSAPVCHIVGFGDSSVDYILRFWISDTTLGLTNVRGNVYLALWDAFRENGISIPFPQREVRLLGDDSPGKPPSDAP
ncbi:mechanosensitive ion channel family protein [Chachezhania antarctica]|uniref:mechanosensitive ion channel family protein n=1 Tax=Chachezhania antarctica TaxID=2340860 RepID=UPI000EAD42CC|nr:mechanosensitive ion channel domain-containing protein [Chachezhania antarctica]|tara:strand:- start:619 stop:2007 length:1389 start_codon:yes stop_codon:yes gene_type:complete